MQFQCQECFDNFYASHQPVVVLCTTCLIEKFGDILRTLNPQKLAQGFPQLAATWGLRFTPPPSVSLTGPASCPVCRQGSGEDGRERVVERIMIKLRQAGKFEMKGLEDFWRGFRSDLCTSCQTKLDSLTGQPQKGRHQRPQLDSPPNKLQQARQLLEEADKLDPHNKTIKQNLEAVRKM